MDDLHPFNNVTALASASAVVEVVALASGLDPGPPEPIVVVGYIISRWWRPDTWLVSGTDAGITRPAFVRPPPRMVPYEIVRGV